MSQHFLVCVMSVGHDGWLRDVLGAFQVGSEDQTKVHTFVKDVDNQFGLIP